MSKVQRIPWRCSECGTHIVVAINRTSQPNLCGDCRLERRRERQRVEHKERGVTRNKYHQTWEVLDDPDESWGYGTTLSIWEWKDIEHKRGYLCQGLKIKEIHTQEVRVFTGERFVKVKG